MSVRAVNVKLKSSFFGYVTKSTDPSSLSVHMNASDVLCQIRTAVEGLRTEVPAAGEGHGLGPGGADTALSVHHSGGGAPTGHCALHLHQGAADT